MAPLRIGFLGYEQANALDLVGPAEAFASAFRDNGEGKLERCYEVSIIGLTRRPFVAESGIVFQPTSTIENAPKLDTLIIPGGCGLRLPDINRKAVDWILERAKGTRRIASVCTGIYGLAATGLLDGRRVTTHWRFAADVAKRFPKLKMESNALFVKDGQFYSSAGVTSGIDLALALIEEDFGSKMALAVAREMVVYLKRSGGQEQYSEPLQFQTDSSDRLAELVAWMTNNPTKPMSVESLARRASLSPRQFFRRFKEHFGSSPALFVETLRLNEARRRLSAGESSIENVAESVGFNGADSFRRAFERRFRVTPSKYRRSFGLSEGRAPTKLAAQDYSRRKPDYTHSQTSYQPRDPTMNRRKFLTAAATIGTALTTLPSGRALLGADETNSSQAKGLVTGKSKLTPPAKGSIPVAILISEGLNVIDFSGPWGVFESVSLPNATEPPFHLFTVAEKADLVVSGSGLKLMPHYTFANVPEIKVVVIPAQKGSDALIDWLRKTVPTTDVTMSVCTGAFKLAKAGLLSGKAATTHHEYLDELQKMFPDIQVKRDVRFVENEKISTAGGLTSGTDLALRVVERYFGREVAQTTATYMEYQSKGWIV